LAAAIGNVARDNLRQILISFMSHWETAAFWDGAETGLFGGFDTVIIQPAVKGRPAHAQQAGGPCTAAPGLFQRRLHPVPVVAVGRVRGFGQRFGIEDFKGQVFFVEDRARAAENGGFDDSFQLSDVAGP
jgi:hypothetical protein